MITIKRLLTQTILEKLKSSNKGVIIYGARQVGKTTLAASVIEQMGLKTLIINGDQSRYIDILSSRDEGKIRDLVAAYEMLFIDEAQRIPEIGLALKIILDSIKNLKVLVTGSSSLDLASKISEPLTGRVWTYRLYPISLLELSATSNYVELDASLEERLVFGSYPELFSITGYKQKKEYLQNLSDAYLYTDLLGFGDVRNSSKIRDLLKLLAFQIGSEVSLTEIGGALGMAKDTVARYIDLLEKSFVIFRLSGFSRNLRKEVTKLDKIFFYDVGIRNTLIDNLELLANRSDGGALWENFLIVERMKFLAYSQRSRSMYFWRTYTGAELDYVEEHDGLLQGYEFKTGLAKAGAPQTWLSTYKNASFECINRSNYPSFVVYSDH